MLHPAGFPPILVIVAVLFCAGLLTAFYQALFPRPARWPLIGAAFVLGAAITAVYAYFLPPASERLVGIVDAWTALKAMALAAGLPEEAVKLAATLIALFLFRRGLTPAEAFQASLVTALGFAALENIQYARALPEAALPIAFGRGIVASFVHSMMGMFLGTFLAALVRSGWRRWDYVVIGYAVAALAHSLFDWGLVRPLLEYLRNQKIRPESVMEALPIIIPCVLGVIIASLTLFVRQLKLCGAEYDDAQRAAVFDDAGGLAFERHLGLRRRWRKVGNVIGIVGLVGSIVMVVAASLAMRGQPQPTDLSQVTPEELHASIVMTVILVFSPMLIMTGILVRQKQ
ncbi:PrsW family intramembrane metalloprotease [Dongia sedimenti]|uniref:PrsW family glutamic-type intramembrane protease n=1 Tax=Dongia sedimenti TaxID=3064282 RepID=A0ABU0YEZ1_9PROT|nr:PrsW family glutamic-type intramembrane protease [Rhodospirillaceae bacterium R-7]